MSVQFDSSRKRGVVRWYEAGRQHSRRFADEDPARGFDEQLRTAAGAARQADDAKLAGELARLRARVQTIEQLLPNDARSSGVSAYPTRQGVRWRVTLPQPQGGVTTRRGYPTREAARRARDQLLALAPPAAEASFARYWRPWLADKRAYITDGALEDLETHGRKRLLPHFGRISVGEITEADGDYPSGWRGASAGQGVVAVGAPSRSLRRRRGRAAVGPSSLRLDRSSSSERSAIAFVTVTSRHVSRSPQRSSSRRCVGQRVPLHRAHEVASTHAAQFRPPFRLHVLRPTCDREKKREDAPCHPSMARVITTVGRITLIGLRSDRQRHAESSPSGGSRPIGGDAKRAHPPDGSAQHLRPPMDGDRMGGFGGDDHI
jgi:hypothetical protein